MKKNKNIGKTRITPKKKRRKKVVIISLVLLLLLAAALVYYFYFYKGKKLELPIKLPAKEEKKLTIIDQDSNKRPIAVMIDNNVGMNKHAGLQDAFVTYEAIVEGGLTRIMVIFKDRTTALIGPVRSSRHYFLDYALEHDALYAHFGWSTFAQKDIASLGVDNINGLYVDRAYWRDKSIAAPHNVFTNIETLYQSAENLNYSITSTTWQDLNLSTENIDLTKFENKDVTCNKEETCNKNPELQAASKVIVPYSKSQTRSYSYDSDRKVYLRFMNGQAHTDKVSKEQYSYKNIIIQKVSNHTLDSDGRQDLNTTGSGEGYYITNGYALPIFWNKNSRSGKTTYTYSDGSKVKLNDGNTFVQIEPATASPSFES